MSANVTAPASRPDPVHAAFAVETDSHTLKHRSVRGAAATLVSQGLRIGLQFGSQIALARLLSPGDFGLIAMVAPLLVLVQIFNELGLSQATIQRAVISHEELSQLFWINSLASLALAGIMALCAPLVASFYGEPDLVKICLGLSALLVLSGLSAQQIALMNRRMRFTTLALIDVACAVMAVVVGISAAWLGLRYWSLVLMQAANSATILVLCWALSDWRPARPRGLSEVGGLLRFGGHLTGSNLVNYAATNLDSVLIGRVAGSVALGLYDRAFKLVAAPIWQISMPVARVAVSLLSRTHDTPQRYRRAFLRMLQMLLLVTTPAVIWTAMTSATVVPLLLGAAWTSAAPIVSALAVATAFAPFSIGAGWLFISQNRAGEQLRYSFVKAGLAIASLLAGLPWGALGVAVSAALCAVFVHGSQLWGACRTGPVSRRDVAAACAPLLAGSLAAALGLRLFEHFVADAGLALGLELAGGAALSYGCFGLAMLVFGEGRRLLADAARLHRFTGAARPADSRS